MIRRRAAGANSLAWHGLARYTGASFTQSGVRAMLFKFLVVIVLLIILSSLASGLYFLIKDQGGGDRTVKALTVRIGLSIALFLVLMVGYATGIITPHGVYY